MFSIALSINSGRKKENKMSGRKGSFCCILFPILSIRLDLPLSLQNLFKYHQWLTRHIGRHLDSTDPMRIRNSLIVLKEVMLC